MDGSKIVFINADKEYFWLMPSDYILPRPEVLKLAEHVLMRPYGIHVDVPFLHEKSNRKRTALAFSGGVDSAAAFNLVDNSIPIFTKVDNPGGAHKLENALLAAKEFGALVVESNQDLLPLSYGKKRGFYGAAGWTVTSILLSDYLQVDTFADGNIIDFVYLRSENGHGTMFKEPNISNIREQFKRIGYEYMMPCAGLSEVSTTKIAKNYRYVMGCMRGVGGVPCLNCMKCYRKMALQGSPIESNSDSEKILNKSWIPVLASLLWSRDNCGLSHPVLDKINKDYSWVDKWFPNSIEFIPEYMRNDFLEKLKKYDISTLSDLKSIYEWRADV